MTKLVLNLGDKVRNIRQSSNYKGLIGFIVEEKQGKHGDKWIVKYQNGKFATYFKGLAHISLEKVETPTHHCKCVHDEVCDKCARQLQKALTFFERYGAGTKTIAGHMAQNRKVLKRERRNVITGMTQSNMHRQHGAEGVVVFNTRATGRSTGQAFRILGEAMCNPGIAIRIQDVDHAISEGKGNRWQLNKHFEHILRDTIGDMKGFHFEHGHITFNPIVTEETYVNI